MRYTQNVLFRGKFRFIRRVNLSKVFSDHFAPSQGKTERFSIAISAVLAAAVAPAAQAYTEVTSFTYDGHSYKAFTNSTQITWTEARNFALSTGGDLVSLNTSAENNFVFSQIGTSASVNGPALWYQLGGDYFGPYIGLFQQPGSPEPGQGWQWVDGNSLSYTSWYSGQPDNATNDDVVFYFNNLNQWGDTLNCSTLSYPCSSNNNPSPNNILAKSLIVEYNSIAAPAPVPVLGIFAAFQWGRRLRRRTKKTYKF